MHLFVLFSISEFFSFDNEIKKYTHLILHMYVSFHAHIIILETQNEFWWTLTLQIFTTIFLPILIFINIPYKNQAFYAHVLKAAR